VSIFRRAGTGKARRRVHLFGTCFPTDESATSMRNPSDSFRRRTIHLDEIGSFRSSFHRVSRWPNDGGPRLDHSSRNVYQLSSGTRDSSASAARAQCVCIRHLVHSTCGSMSFRRFGSCDRKSQCAVRRIPIDRCNDWSQQERIDHKSVSPRGPPPWEILFPKMSL